MATDKDITGKLTRREDLRTFILARRLGQKNWRKFCDFVEAFIEMEAPVSARRLREIIAADLKLPDAEIHENTVRVWIRRAQNNDGKVPQPINLWRQ